MLPEQRAFTILDSTILIKTDQCGTPPIVEAFDNTVPLGLLCVSSVHQVLNMHPLYGSILFFLQVGHIGCLLATCTFFFAMYRGAKSVICHRHYCSASQKQRTAVNYK